MIITKGEKPHTNTQVNIKGKLEWKMFIIQLSMQLKSQRHINQPSIWWPQRHSIIRIHIISWIQWMFALVVASIALQNQLPMGFTLPHTKLAFKHLRSLSCQILGSPATLTTWVSTLFVRVTDSLECQDQWRNLTKNPKGAKLYLLYINYFFN